MKALLTGGAGFIGSHLADALLAQGHDVAVIDDFSTGSRDNIAHLEGRPGFSCVEDSVMHEARMAELVDRCDVIFHLAAAVGVKLIVDAPVRTIETNVHGTEIVLAQASRHGKLVVVFSSSEVYGKSAAVPFREDADLVFGPTHKQRWAYACSKALDEFLALAYGRERALPVIIVRLFNTVGPRQTDRYGMVIPTFVRQALTDVPITIHGDGRQTRCFTDVRDVVNGVGGRVAPTPAGGPVVKRGSTEEITMLDLARRVKTLTGSRSELTLVPYDQAYVKGFEDMPRRVPDLSRIGALIGYQPAHTLDDVLERVIEYERAALQIGIQRALSA